MSKARDYERMMKSLTLERSKADTSLQVNKNRLQASKLTQNDTGPVGPVTPSIYWSCKFFTGPTFFL